MKRIKFIIITLLLTAAMPLGLVFAPVFAAAEVASSTSEDYSIFIYESAKSEEVIDSEETSEFEPKIYVLEEDGNRIELTLIDEENAVAELSVHGVPLATVYMYYEYLTTDSISLYASGDDSYFGDFNLYTDGTMAGIDYAYSPDNSADDSAESLVGEPTEERDHNTILLPVVCGIVGLAGAGLLCLLLNGKLGKLKKAFSDIVSWFTKKKEELATEEIDLKKFKEDLTTAICSNKEIKAWLEKSYESNKEQYLVFKQAIEDTVKTATEMVSEIKKDVVVRMEEFEKKYDQICGILVKMAAGNAELVRQGIADNIIKSLEVKKTKKE